MEFLQFDPAQDFKLLALALALPITGYLIQIFFGKHLPRKGDWMLISGMFVTMCITVLMFAKSLYAAYNGVEFFHHSGEELGWWFHWFYSSSEAAGGDAERLRGAALRPAGRGHADGRGRGLLLRAPVLERVHEGGQPLPHLLREHLAVHVRDAQPGPVGQHPLPVHLLGSDGPDELPAHRPLQPRQDLGLPRLGDVGLQEGLHDDARGRRLPPGGHPDVLPGVRDLPLHRAVGRRAGRRWPPTAASSRPG